jgi:hypothetical protein
VARDGLGDPVRDLRSPALKTGLSSLGGGSHVHCSVSIIGWVFPQLSAPTHNLGPDLMLIGLGGGTSG